jgi:DNA-binding NarL/FixJ family response regulator
MGSIKLAVVGIEGRFAGALAAFLSQQPIFDLVDPDEAELVVTDIESLPWQTEDAALLVVGPDSAQAMVEAVDSGAMGYVVSGTPLQELADAAEAVASGEAVVPPMMLGALLKHVVQRRRASRADLERLDSLTQREREVFDLLAAGLDRNLIAEHLYISVGTVRSHLQRVFAKLNVHTHAQAVAFAARCGVQVDDPGVSP